MALENSVFTAGETHGRALRPGNRLLLHSQDAGWRSLYAASFQEAPLDTREAPIGHPSFIYHISRPTEVTREIEGAPCEQALIGPRRICVTPGESATRWRHSGRPQILQVYLRKSIYDGAVEEMYGCDPRAAGIVPRFAMPDPLLEQLALAILGALRDGTAEDGLYIDSMAQLIAAHLARMHSSHARSERAAPADGLSRHRLLRLAEYIDEHLDGDLSLRAMAAEVGLSPLYLSRAFKTALGRSPHQYVLDRRVERAKQLLRDTDAPIVDVALATGFSSQSHLSERFLRSVGLSPAAYRRQR